MRDAPNGLSTETRSLNGNRRRVLCFGFIVNVRVSPFHPRVSDGDLVLQRGQERQFFRTHHSTRAYFRRGKYIG
jgi:hypothetical protein